MHVSGRTMPPQPWEHSDCARTQGDARTESGLDPGLGCIDPFGMKTEVSVTPYIHGNCDPFQMNHGEG